MVDLVSDSGKIRQSDQINFFFTKISTTKGSKTFAHGLGYTPSVVIAYALSNVTKIAYKYTFGKTNVISNNPSLTVVNVIYAA